jgi:hypothetical protein
MQEGSAEGLGFVQIVIFAANILSAAAALLAGVL